MLYQTKSTSDKLIFPRYYTIFFQKKMEVKYSVESFELYPMTKHGKKSSVVVDGIDAQDHAESVLANHIETNNPAVVDSQTDNTKSKLIKGSIQESRNKGLFKTMIKSSPKYKNSILSSPRIHQSLNPFDNVNQAENVSPKSSKSVNAHDDFYSTLTLMDNESVNSDYATADESFRDSLLSFDSKLSHGESILQNKSLYISSGGNINNIIMDFTHTHIYIYIYLLLLTFIYINVYTLL